MPPPEPNERLRAAREATPSRRTPGLGMSRDELAEAVVLWLAEHDPKHRMAPFDGGHLGKIERGQVRLPGRHYVAALCAVVGASPAELGFADSPGTSSRPLPAAPGTADPQLPEPVVWAADKPWKVGPDALDALATVLAATRRLEDTTSAAAVVPTIDHHVRIVDTLAREARSAHRCKAVALASELHTYRGWLAIDTHDYAAASRHLHHGVVLAVEANIPDLLGQALSFDGFLALIKKQYGPAASKVEAAQRETRSASLRTHYGFLAARILAIGGESRESDAFLRRADAMLEHWTGDDLHDGTYWYQPSFLVAQRGLVHAYADRPRQAVADLTYGLDTMPDDLRNAEWTRLMRTKLAEMA